MAQRKKRRGSAILEFALTGVPLIFIWISIVQMSIGMWRYHTLQYAVKMSASYIAVHGSDCVTNFNTCGIQIQDAASVLRNAATGIPPDQISVVFTALKPDHVTAGDSVTCTLNNCLTDATAWPPFSYSSPGYDTKISASFNFHSAMRMLWPGAGVVSFGNYTMSAQTQQMILF